MVRIFLVLFGSLLFSLLYAQPEPEITKLKQHILFLSSETLAGRLAGSKGEKLAAEYLQKELQTMNLKAPGNSMFYPFSYVYRSKSSFGKSSDTLTINAINVVAMLDNKADKTIVIGAHYDHLGLNERKKSLGESGNSNWNPGADDNASGVAGVLELARMLSGNTTTESANYIFAFFSAEEDGIVGSVKLAELLVKSASPVSLMINLDMIGRLDSLKQLYIGGIGTSPAFSFLPAGYPDFDFRIHTDSSGVGSSDHTAFYTHDIPVLFFHTGAHADYHKPTDTPDKINFKGMQQVVGLIYKTVMNLSEKDTIAFTKTRTPSQTRANMKVSLGIMPRHMDSGVKGLLVDVVMEGKPAAKSGIQKGDIILQIGDCTVNDVYEYMECLSALNKNVCINIKIMREGVVKNIEVTL